MKKHITFLKLLTVVPIFFFCGCSEDYSAPTFPPILEIADEYKIVQFPAVGEERTIPVNTTVRDWSFELENKEDGKWIFLNKEGGIKFKVSPNLSITERKATVNVKAENLLQVIQVSQPGATPELTVGTNRVTVTSEAITREIMVNTNIPDWTVSVAESDDTWCTAIKESQDVLKISILANLLIKDRNTKVIIASDKIDEHIEITVDQQGSYVKIPLQASDLSSNAPDPSEGVNMEDLLDDDYSTYFHTSWRGTIPAPHWLQADLKEELSDYFKLYYRTRTASDNNAHNPIDFDLLGSTNAEDWFLIRNFTVAADNLPEKGGSKDYMSDVYKIETPFRYIRMVVNRTTNNTDYWSLSEFKFYKASTSK